MKTKTKNKTRTTKRSAARKPKSKQYAAHYLAVTLAVVLIVEGLVMGSTTATNLPSAISVLDISSGVAQTISNLSFTIQPATDLVASVAQFYQIATTEMASLLDASNYVGGLSLAYDGINEFYQQASVQMADLLDVSGSPMLLPQVAGLSIIR